MKIEVYVLADGSIVAHHSNLFERLLKQQPLRARRLTNIEFNDATQLWEVHSVTGKLLQARRSRELCLYWENVFVDRLMAQLFEGMCPHCQASLPADGQVHLTCPACHQEQPIKDCFGVSNLIRDPGELRWSDFSLDTLLQG